MIELNLLRVIDISSKKDLTVGAYAFRTSLRADKLLMFSPMGFSDQTSNCVSKLGLIDIYVPTWGRVLELVGLAYWETCFKYSSFFFIFFCTFLFISLLYLLYHYQKIIKIKILCFFSRLSGLLVNLCVLCLYFQYFVIPCIWFFLCSLWRNYFNFSFVSTTVEFFLVSDRRILIER